MEASPHVKILGVLMDGQFRYHEHAARIAKGDLGAAQALRRLRGLQPNMARQLYTSMVTPVVEYASVAIGTPLDSAPAQSGWCQVPDTCLRLAALTRAARLCAWL